MFLDDVGVTVTMISVTLLAVIVVLLKIFIFSEQVKIKLFNIVHKNATTKLGWVTITTGYNEVPNASPQTKKIHLEPYGRVKKCGIFWTEPPHYVVKCGKNK